MRDGCCAARHGRQDNELGTLCNHVVGRVDALHRECKTVPSQMLMSQLLGDGTLILGGSLGPCGWAKCCQAMAQHPFGVRDVSAIFLVTSSS